VAMAMAAVMVAAVAVAAVEALGAGAKVEEAVTGVAGARLEVRAAVAAAAVAVRRHTCFQKPHHRCTRPHCTCRARRTASPGTRADGK
jgi:hypothetical protein